MVSEMSLSGSLSRASHYYQKHGLRPSLRRVSTTLRKLSVFGQMVLYYYDFPSRDTGSAARELPSTLKVERKTDRAEVDLKDWEQIVNFWNPEISSRNFLARFREGASLWMIRSEGKLAGYGWTLTGRTMEPHYLPVGPNDVHLFDFLVFPGFRGRNLNPLLVTFILDQMAVESRTRAYIESAAWNNAQLASLGKTDFRLFGVARKLSLLGWTFIQWGNIHKFSASKNVKMGVKA